MRRHYLYIFLCATLLLGWGIPTFEASEPAIEMAVSELAAKMQSDADAASGYICGGLLSAGDDRVLAYYQRERKPLECTLDAYCSTYDDAGNCTGVLCEVVRLRGVRDRWFAKDCSSGSCVTSAMPMRCDMSGGFGQQQSNMRIWECGRAQAKCYSFDPDVQYPESAFPFSYNCVLTYDSSPVLPTDPRGKPSLVTPHTLPAANRSGEGPWETVRGSNIAVESAPDYRKPKDSVRAAIDLDRATSAVVERVKNAILSPLIEFSHYPELEQTLGRLLQPPEIRLILPKGGLSLGYEHSPLFTRIFSSLGGDPPSTPVTRTIGNAPDALRTAAEYLRSIPLMEVEYVPVNVLVPYASVSLLHQLTNEWESWRDSVQSELNPDVLVAVQHNITMLQSYVDLQESVRSYRLHFPRYIDALLSYTESANRFFRTEWIQLNANRLDEWHAAYAAYLPELQKDLHTLYAAASVFTRACLAEACRMDTIPVQSWVQPWTFTGAEVSLAGADRAWLPEAFPLWENAGGQVTEWHPPISLGQPLPDITLDLSEIFLNSTIQVPVLKVEMHTIDLPFPPPYTAENVNAHMGELRATIRPLPDLSPPLFDLEFPALIFPNPDTSLFVVPEPPRAMQSWKGVVMQRIRRLEELQARCDSSPAPTRFLVHEFLLYDPRHRDPGAVRAAALVEGLSQTSFEKPSVLWPTISRTSESMWGVPLKPPEECPECSTVRPQRYIRQHAELDVSFAAFQDALIRVIDEWNAQVKFISVIDRQELVQEEFDFDRASSLPKDLLRSPSP
jgi:hypothetical protein